MSRRHPDVWRITRRVGAWPLIEDVDADDFVIENSGRQLVLYVDTLVVDEPRRVVVRRLDARDIAAVEQLCPACATRHRA